MNSLETVLKDWLSSAGDLPSVYLVGGVVRDHLLGRSWKDIDLICRNAEQFARRIAQTRNAATVPFEKKADEPCYRVVDLDNRSRFIDIAEMRGDTVYEDLSRRDFTINAIAVRITENGRLGDILDPLSGCRDVKEGVIRVVSPEAFVSDPLRLLRAFRFAAELGFQIESSTQSEITGHADLIRRSSSERIWHELLLILNSKNACECLRLMDERQVLVKIFPEIGDMKNCPQNAYHHLNVWDHSMLVLKQCEQIIGHLPEYFGAAADNIRENLSRNNRAALLKMAALIHDIGKPGTRQYQEQTNRIIFHGHDKKGESAAAEIGMRLRLSVRDQEFIRLLVAEHMHALSLSGPQVKKNTRNRLIRKLKDDFIPLLILSMADVMSSLGPESKEEDRVRHLEWSDETANAYYETIKQTMETKNLISGKDLMDIGMDPGPEMGRIISHIREAQDSGLIENQEQAVMLAKKLIAEILSNSKISS